MFRLTLACTEELCTSSALELNKSAFRSEFHLFLRITREEIYCKVTLGRFRVTTVAVEKQEASNFKSVFVALGNQHAMHMLHVVICGLCSSTIFFRNIS